MSLERSQTCPNYGHRLQGVPQRFAATNLAASATGAVPLVWSAVGWVVAAAALIGLWHAAIDPKAGRRAALDSKKTEAVEKLLKRQLGEWPGTAQ